jgi:hypothetical protein
MTIRSRSELRLTTARLAALLVLGLAGGCGGSGDSGSKATAPDAAPVAAAAPAVASPIAASKFEPITELKDGELTLGLETDLPDSTTVMWRAYRPYVREIGGEKLDYSVSLGSGRTTVGELKKGWRIDVSEATFKRLFAEQRAQVEARHQSFRVHQVGKELMISLIVPIDQNPPFAKLNSNLKGPMVIEKEFPGLGTGRVINWDKPVK